MFENKTVIELDFKKFNKINELFKKHTGIDLDNIPTNYGDSILNAKKILDENIKVISVFQSASIEDNIEGNITLSSGDVLTGTMAKKILKNSSEVLCFVISLQGFTEAVKNISGVMENYFIDIFGSVYVENAENALKEHVNKKLNKKRLRRTHVWNPGQYNFELDNQRPIFNFLKPEDNIGTILDKHLRMLPLKSSSGIMGITSIDVPVKEDLLPCDYCSLTKTCPASKSKKPLN